MPQRRSTAAFGAAALAFTSLFATAGAATAGAATAGAAPVASLSPPSALSANLALAVGPAAKPFAAGASGCQLGNGVQHVFYLGFDNFHLRRDNSNNVAGNGDNNRNTDLNIPSDLEQVPALYNFLRGTSNAGTTPNASTANNANYADGRSTTYSDGSSYPGGTILANQHTPLISHTSDDFTATYSGVYGDRNGVANSQNSIAAYTGNASAPVATASGFSYWTDPLGIGNDPTTTITTKDSSGNAINAPAPWVPFTRAGCDVGAVSATGLTLENAASVKNASTPSVTLTAADEGLAVHCAIGSKVCGDTADTAVKAVPDNLPSEPGGYTGYSALYGHKSIAPALNDLGAGGTAGSATLPLLRSPSTSSFPGFNGEDGNYTLGYTLAMQKAGIPITFGYLSDAHDCHSTLYADYATSGTGAAQCGYSNAAGSTAPTSAGAFGSGEQGYVNYLQQLNTDFQSFFNQTKAAGYTTANTEFVFYSDENDHAAEATPANGTGATPCDGVTVACQWAHNSSATSPPASGGQLGELTISVDATLPTRSKKANQPYFVLNDSAPDFYLSNPGSATPPAQTDTSVRNFERDLGNATYTDPYTGASTNLTNYEADQTELAALHMVTADPQRTPTVVSFAPGEDYVENGQDCTAGNANGNTCSNSGFDYIHGDFAPETNTTWAAFAGPGVANNGVDKTDWTDHVDIRPTLLGLVGLTDDYTDDGRIVTQIVKPGAVQPALQTQTAADLGTILKKLNAATYSSSEGANDGFGSATAVADTVALKSNAVNDSLYTYTEACISTITGQRNAVVSDIQARLTAAASGVPIESAPASTDLSNGQRILADANMLKAYTADSTKTAPTDCPLASAPVPALSETSHTALLILTAGVVMAGGLLILGRRRRPSL